MVPPSAGGEPGRSIDRTCARVPGPGQRTRRPSPARPLANSMALCRHSMTSPALPPSIPRSQNACVTVIEPGSSATGRSRGSGRSAKRTSSGSVTPPHPMGPFWPFVWTTSRRRKQSSPRIPMPSSRSAISTDSRRFSSACGSSPLPHCVRRSSTGGWPVHLRGSLSGSTTGPSRRPRVSQPCGAGRGAIGRAVAVDAAWPRRAGHRSRRAAPTGCGRRARRHAILGPEPLVGQRHRQQSAGVAEASI